jgi:uncharacterized protein with von Willebrand factor type A (vWA) domain
VVTSPATGVVAQRRQATLDRAAAAEVNGMRALADAAIANSYPPELRHNAEQFRKVPGPLAGQRSAKLRSHRHSDDIAI